MQALPPSSTSSASQNIALPGNPSSSKLVGVNDLGDVVVNASNGKMTVAYVGHSPYAQGDFQRKGVPGSLTTSVTAINNAGMVVGFYADRSGKIAAFTEKNGVWSRDLGPSASTTIEYLGVNDSGSVVGFYTDRHGNNHAFVRDQKSGELASIRPAGGVSVTANAINDGGDVVGSMMTERGRVQAFLWSTGRVTELSYPGAVETKALGIGKDGRIVGTYKDASGATHGFILRGGGSSTPQWKSFDAHNAHRLTVLSGINSGGELVGYYADESSHLRAFVSRVKKQSSTIPLVIPVWGYGGAGPDTDPGATPDQHLFAAILDNTQYSSKSLAKNCPGVSSTSTCSPYKYIDLIYDPCNTSVGLAAYQWANTNDESAFLHTYPNGMTSSNRITWYATPNPNCKPNSHNAVMRMNPGDPAYNAYLYENVWAGSNYQNDFPAPYGVMEDETEVFAGITVGGEGSSEVSTEYGSGTKPSGFANLVGISKYHVSMDWETAIGIFINGACAARCVNFAFNGIATGMGDNGPCDDIKNGHCHGKYQAGDIDNQAAIDNICLAAVGGNLKYFMAERPIFAGRGGFGFLDSQTLVVHINTQANLYSHTSGGCTNTKIMDLEPSYGLGGVGDVAGGYRVRTEGLAIRWLVPNPSTGIPDRVLSFQYTEGGTKTEAPYFFEDTLVPYGPETSVPKFVWNGKVETTGGGCPSTHGDTGGAVALLVQCVGSDGVYCQQYQHLYINGSDYGNVAACLNTSTSTENIESSWFKHDPISTYRYELSLQGGEMTSVPYQGVSGGSIAMTTCTNKTYCTGKNTLAAQVASFKGDGTDTLCGPCGVILLRNKSK